MDRHICGACHAEINDLEEFIVHKRQTCPDLFKKNEKTCHNQWKEQAQISSGLVNSVKDNTDEVGAGSPEEHNASQTQTCDQNNYLSDTGHRSESDPAEKLYGKAESSTKNRDHAPSELDSGINEESSYYSTLNATAIIENNHVASSADMGLFPNLDHSKVSSIVMGNPSDSHTIQPAARDSHTIQSAARDDIGNSSDSLVCAPPAGHEYIQTVTNSTGLRSCADNSSDKTAVISDNTSDTTANNPKTGDTAPGVSKSLQMVLDHNGSYTLLSKLQIPTSLYVEKGNVLLSNDLFHQMSVRDSDQVLSGSNVPVLPRQEVPIHTVLDKCNEQQLNLGEQIPSDSVPICTSSCNDSEKSSTHVTIPTVSPPTVELVVGQDGLGGSDETIQNEDNTHDCGKISHGHSTEQRKDLQRERNPVGHQDDSFQETFRPHPYNTGQDRSTPSPLTNHMGKPTKGSGKDDDTIAHSRRETIPSTTYKELKSSASSVPLYVDKISHHGNTSYSSMHAQAFYNSTAISDVACNQTDLLTKSPEVTETQTLNQTSSHTAADQQTSNKEIIQSADQQQSNERHSSTGIQYVLHKTPERNYFLPINKGAYEENNTPPESQVEEQITPEEVNSRVTSPVQTEYTIQMQSIDHRSVLQGQIIQVINTSEKYHNTAAKKTSSVLPKKSSSAATREREKKFACDKCSYSTIYLKDLTRHHRTHTGEKPYKCGMCDKSFSRLDKLRLHIRAHTGEKPYECTYCTYKAVDSSALKKHMIIHTDERPYVCQLCHYSCRTSSQLTVHLRTHTGDCPFTCPICKRKFKIKSDLKRHYLTHTGEKPWQCTQCDTKFTTQGNLLQHVKTHHSPDKLSKCTHCDYKTSSKKAMWEHIKSHKPDKPNRPCVICGFRAASYASLRDHMVVHSYDYFMCSHCDFITQHQVFLNKHIKEMHSEHYYENQKYNSKSSKRAGKNKRSSKSGSNDTESESRRDSKGRKSGYRKFQRTHKCDKCDESFVRKDSLTSHKRLHDDLDRDLNHLSSAGAAFKLKSQQSSRDINRPDDSVQSNQYYVGGSQIINQVIPSEMYYRNESVQTSDDSSITGSHRRQLDFNTVSVGLSSSHSPISTPRVSTDTPHNSRYPKESTKVDDRRRRSTGHEDSGDWSSKRKKSSSHSYSNRPVRDLLKAERQMRSKRSEDNMKKSISDSHLHTPTSKIDATHYRNCPNISLEPHSLTDTFVSNEVMDNAHISSSRKGHADSVNDPRSNQHVHQLPNIQLIQNISLPLVRLPDGRILSTQVGNQLAGTQVIREVNLEQTTLTNTALPEGIPTIQIRAPSTVELLSPSNNSSHELPNVAMPQVVEILDQRGVQFVTCSEDLRSTTVQTDHPLIEQGMMLSPAHMVTVPVQVLDIPTSE